VTNCTWRSSNSSTRRGARAAKAPVAKGSIALLRKLQKTSLFNRSLLHRAKAGLCGPVCLDLAQAYSTYLIEPFVVPAGRAERRDNSRDHDLTISDGLAADSETTRADGPIDAM
jgi:hypothetical protein